MINAVILDLDDTLYPETQYVQSGFREVADFLKNSYNKTDSLQILQMLFEQNRQGVFDRLCEKSHLDKCVAKQMHTVYIGHTPKIKLFSDSLMFLQWLRKNNYQTGLITDGRPQQQNAKIDALGVRHFFKQIIITDELGEICFRKPCPLAFEIMSSKLNIPYNKLVYIGDNAIKDFDAPHKLGMKTIKIIRKSSLYTNNISKANIKAQFEVTSFQEVKDILQNV